jgi:hypothetical protein
MVGSGTGKIHIFLAQPVLHYPPPMESSEVPESVATFDEHLHSFPMGSSTAKDPDSEDEVLADTPKTGDKGKATAAEPI